jgi:hypothetical protein
VPWFDAMDYNRSIYLAGDVNCEIPRLNVQRLTPHAAPTKPVSGNRTGQSRIIRKVSLPASSYIDIKLANFSLGHSGRAH